MSGTEQRGLRRLARVPVWLMIVTMSVVLTAAIAFAATRPQNGSAALPANASSGASASATPSQTGPTESPAPAPDNPELAATIAQIQANRGVSLGIAIVPLSPDGTLLRTPYETGVLRSGMSWATIDVAIALAVVRGTKQPEDLDYLLHRAIIESSPAGDEALWSFLGSEEVAAKLTTDVLRQAGDHTTVVPSTRTLPNHPTYDQTIWSNANQAIFAAGIYCEPDTWTVLTRMDEQPASAKWGLGTLVRTQFKSGSGLQPNGTTLVRQVGVATLSNGTRVGIGMAAVAVDGTEATAQTALTEAAAAIYSQATGFVGGHC